MAQGYLVGLPQRLFTPAGVPADGWLITTYEAGTTTPLETFSNGDLTTPNTPTIETDASGYFRCFVAKGVLVKLVITDADGGAEFTIDNLEPMIDPTAESPVTTAVQTGTVLPYVGLTPPSGYLLCDGSLVSRATYSDLSTLLAAQTPPYPYGAGDASTTFALPDMRGMAPYGVAASGTGDALGDTFGAIDHTHTGPAHTHTVTDPRDGWGSAVETPPTTGRIRVGNAAGVGADATGYFATADQSLTTASGGTGNTGTSNPPGLTFYFIIKT